jgi:hypothetical protein
MAIISGLNNKAGKVIVIDESDWSVEANEDVTAQPDDGYEITVTAGQKLVVFRQSTGEIEAFGNITAADDPVTAQWYSVLDNTYWEATFPGISWDGSKWENLTISAIVLDKLGTWVEGYEPTKVRVTCSGGGALQLYVQDGSSNIVQEIPYTSGTEINITGQVSDIITLTLNADSTPVQITNIEFFSVTDPT